MFVSSHLKSAQVHSNFSENSEQSLAPGSSCSSTCPEASTQTPAISAVHMPGVDNWKANYFFRHRLHQGEWDLHSNILSPICQRWGIANVDIQIKHQFTSICSQDQGTFSTGIECSQNSLDSVQANLCLSYSSNSDSDSHCTKLAQKNPEHKLTYSECKEMTPAVFQAGQTCCCKAYYSILRLSL